jgi:hypothetical protein
MSGAPLAGVNPTAARERLALRDRAAEASSSLTTEQRTCERPSATGWDLALELPGPPDSTR